MLQCGKKQPTPLCPAESGRKTGQNEKEKKHYRAEENLDGPGP